MTRQRRPCSASLVLCCLVIVSTACSAVGLELPNYGYYGFAPRPDGALLLPGSAVERMLRVNGDSTVLAEGTVRIDTVPWGLDGAWVVTRSMPGIDGADVLDSIWLDRWSLRTLASWRRTPDGEVRMRINRRAVQVERRTIDGQSGRQRFLLPAEPYGLAGIEFVIAAMPLSEGYVGSLPMVLDKHAGEMHWMRFTVARGEAMVAPTRAGATFKATWLVTTELDGVTRRFWVAGDDRTVLKREEPGPDGGSVQLVRGRRMPRVQLAPVERLPH